MQVVGDDADHGGVEIVLHDSLQQCRHVARGGAFAHHQMTAVAQPLKYVLIAEGFVVGGDTGGDAGAHRRAVHIGQMALKRHTGDGQRIVERLQQIGELGQNVRTDALRQPHRIRPLERLADDLRVEAAAAGFQIGRERNMGRNDKIDLQIRGLCLFQDGLDALQTGHDANLVQIRHDARRAVSQNGLRKRTDRQRRAFRMDVPIEEAGRQIIAPASMTFVPSPMQYATSPTAAILSPQTATPPS